jgi:lysozyme
MHPSLSSPSRLSWRCLVPALILALGACQTAPEEEPTLGEEDQASMVCASGPTTRGIDVSFYQGTINWHQVKASGVQFAFIRVSDGLYSLDSKFATNWAGAKAAGVLRGVYQFFEPGQSPVAQADLMIAHMGTLGPDDLSPVIDVEATDGLSPTAVATSVKAWISRVKTKTGRTPIVYSGYYFWNGQVGGANVLPSPFWVAAYVKPCPQVPAHWTKWSFWQYSSSGSVPGIPGRVDMDTFWGTRAQLLATMAAPAVCGDHKCNGGETFDACPQDCLPCGTIPAAGGVVDDGDKCFVGGGPTSFLRDVAGHGWESDLIWTHATSLAAESNFGQWNLVLKQAGRYQVEAYTDHAYAQSKQAKYKLKAGGATHTVALDQTAVSGWQPLGEFDFAAGGKQWVHLGDNTGEPGSANRQVVFDAIRLTPVTAVTPPTDGGVPDVDAGGDAGADGGIDNAAQGDHAGCAAGGSGAGLWCGLLALGMVIRRRRGRALARATLRAGSRSGAARGACDPRSGSRRR